MFGAERKAGRPVLLVLVFGVLLVLVGITATAQAVMVSAYATSTTLQTVVEGDVSTIRGFAVDGLDDLDLADPAPAVLARIQRDLGTLLAKGGIAHVEIRTPNGTVVAASTTGNGGDVRPPDADFASAVEGSPRLAILDGADATLPGIQLPTTVIREYLPLTQGGRTLLVVGIWRDAAGTFARLDDLRRDVVLVTLTAAVVAAVVLFAVFRTAQRRISRQTAALLVAARQDPLTDALNHGAVVEHLAQEIERSHRDGTVIGLVLFDVDNFRLLNDTHGHAAGDDVLRTVADLIQGASPEGATIGRFGPDELLVVIPGGTLERLRGLADEVRTSLAECWLQFDETEQLPLTVSAGIGLYPEHGRSLTDLLAQVAATLQEARAAGGDAVRVTGEIPVDPEFAASKFDILQGLVLAVDTKDRYTKRHSEDVARYAVFLGRQLNLDEAFLRTIHTAGLLHDVGKIGIPDTILRKPSRLTADELEIVKQHVALGDLIVRDLPDIERIRDGIRHHHERWDGRGYLQALAGEDIPLIARILAVGDSFSAMTTTRPYRKALDVREALLRLSDSAGDQLDETLVEVFIRSMETVSDAPMPGAPAPGIWLPGSRVA